MKRRLRGNHQQQRAEARGVSLPKDLLEQVDRRLAELHPKVKGFSHYIQLLVDRDLKDGPKPFKEPDHRLDRIEQLELLEAV